VPWERSIALLQQYRDKHTTYGRDHVNRVVQGWDLGYFGTVWDIGPPSPGWAEVPERRDAEGPAALGWAEAQRGAGLAGAPSGLGTGCVSVLGRTLGKDAQSTSKSSHVRIPAFSLAHSRGRSGPSAPRWLDNPQGLG
jgi:hypothetical protein